MPSSLFEPLDWDSRFFGFGIGRLRSSIKNEAELSNALREAADHGVSLVYGSCAPGDHEALAACERRGGRFVDAKRRYVLAINSRTDIPAPKDSSIRDAPLDPCSRRQLRRLAWAAAEHSRFKRDLDLPAGAWRRLYSIWMANSLSRAIADDVLVYYDGETIVGMLTVAHRSSRSVIGLAAVDPRWRGRGIARQLLDAALVKSIAHGAHALEVVTQGENLTACLLYEAAGFSIEEEQLIHHFWTKNV